MPCDSVVLCVFYVIAEAQWVCDMAVDAEFAFFWARPFGSGQWAYKSHNKAVTLGKRNSLRVPIMLSHAWHGIQTDIQTAPSMQMMADTETVVSVSSHNL